MTYFRASRTLVGSLDPLRHAGNLNFNSIYGSYHVKVSLSNTSSWSTYDRAVDDPTGSLPRVAMVSQTPWSLLYAAVRLGDCVGSGSNAIEAAVRLARVRRSLPPPGLNSGGSGALAQALFLGGPA
jgi:hypothetical protein